MDRSSSVSLRLAFLLLLASLVQGATGQEANPATSLSDDQITKLVNNLGSETYADREESEAKLRQAGARAKAALTQAARQSADAEIKMRATRLLAVICDLTLDLGGGVKTDFVLIPAGKFMMGSEKGRPADQPAHEVTLSKPYLLGKYLVTQEQWQALMGHDPSNFKGPRNPVEQVSWNEAQEFCRKMTTKTGKTVRLPTEAEWEYACRAGSTTAYSFGDSARELAAYGWYNENSDGATHPVGAKKPNAWGLYDMHGNVWEWCQDWYGDYPAGPAVDPQGPASGTARVIRGGGWNYEAENCRSAERGGSKPGERRSSDGFRVVVDVPRTP